MFHECAENFIPPGATRVVVRLTPFAGGTRLELEHTGIRMSEAKKHAMGWPHFLARLGLAASGAEPGPDPWKTSTP